MLHAAAMLIGLFLIGLLLMQRWTAPDIAVVAVAALLSTIVAVRLGGWARTPFSAAPQFVVLAGSRLTSALRGALKIVRAAAAADVTLQPALVRVKTRSSNKSTQAALVGLISAAPGMLAVENDEDGVLVHVTDEAEAERGDLSRVEARVVGTLGIGA